MKKFLKLQLNHFFVPISIALLILAFIVNGQKTVQFELVMAAVVLYVTVGLLHHHYDKSLSTEVILEYVLIAILAVIVLQGLILR